MESQAHEGEATDFCISAGCDPQEPLDQSREEIGKEIDGGEPGARRGVDVDCDGCAPESASGLAAVRGGMQEEEWWDGSDDEEEGEDELEGLMLGGEEDEGEASGGGEGERAGDAGTMPAQELMQHEVHNNTTEVNDNDGDDDVAPSGALGDVLPQQTQVCAILNNIDTCKSLMTYMLTSAAYWSF